MKKPKLLALVSKGLSDEYIQYMLEEAKKSLVEFGIPEADIKDSSTWFREKFSSCGDWDAWIWETVNGRDYMTRQHHFDGFLICTDTLGKANANIAGLALRNQRAVLSWLEDQPIRIVTAVKTVDDTNWAEGWSFETQPQAETP